MPETRSFKCRDCGRPAGDVPDVACECGCTSRVINQEIQETMKVYPSMKAVAKELKPTGGRKKFAEAIVGWELRKSVGDMVRKVREWSRRTNTYFETVHDEDGNLLHSCEEPLSEHLGHGSDKPRP